MSDGNDGEELSPLYRAVRDYDHRIINKLLANDDLDVNDAQYVREDIMRLAITSGMGTEFARRGFPVLARVTANDAPSAVGALCVALAARHGDFVRQIGESMTEAEWTRDQRSCLWSHACQYADGSLIAWLYGKFVKDRDCNHVAAFESALRKHRTNTCLWLIEQDLVPCAAMLPVLRISVLGATIKYGTAKMIVCLFQKGTMDDFAPLPYAEGVEPAANAVSTYTGMAIANCRARKLIVPEVVVRHDAQVNTALLLSDIAIFAKNLNGDCLMGVCLVIRQSGLPLHAEIQAGTYDACSLLMVCTRAACSVYFHTSATTYHAMLKVLEPMYVEAINGPDFHGNLVDHAVVAYSRGVREVLALLLQCGAAPGYEDVWTIVRRVDTAAHALDRVAFRLLVEHMTVMPGDAWADHCDNAVYRLIRAQARIGTQCEIFSCLLEHGWHVAPYTYDQLTRLLSVMQQPVAPIHFTVVVSVLNMISRTTTLCFQQLLGVFAPHVRLHVSCVMAHIDRLCRQGARLADRSDTCCPWHLTGLEGDDLARAMRTQIIAPLCHILRSVREVPYDNVQRITIRRVLCDHVTQHGLGHHWFRHDVAMQRLGDNLVQSAIYNHMRISSRGFYTGNFGRLHRRVRAVFRELLLIARVRRTIPFSPAHRSIVCMSWHSLSRLFTVMLGNDATSYWGVQT